MAPRRGSHWSPFAILAAGLPFVGPTEVSAQTSPAVCGSSFNWMNNSKNQNPCVVAAYLQGACNNGQYTVNALPPYSYYVGPTPDNQNACQCSTVTYNTMSACGLCQNRGYIGWDTWVYNCTIQYIAVFTPGIPSGTAVPQWAFQDVSKIFQFNVTIAESVGDNPESTATHAQSTGSLGTTSTLPPASLTKSALFSATSNPTTTPTSSGGISTAAIAGGAAGGGVGIALIAGAVVYLGMKRKRSQILTRVQSIDRWSPPASPPPPGYADIVPFYSQPALPMVHEPSDPSTLPPSMPSTTTSSKIRNSARNHTDPSMHSGGHNDGAPEAPQE